MCLFACTSTETHQDNFVSSPFNLAVSDTFSLHLDTLTSEFIVFADVCENKGKEYLAIKNKILNAIDVFDLEKGRLQHRIAFAQGDDKNALGNLAGFCIKDFSDMFVFSNHLQKIIRTDTSGVLKSIYRTPDDDLLLVGGYIGIDLMLPIWRNNKIYFSLPPFSDPLEDKDGFSEKYKLEYEWNIKDRSFLPLSVFYPSVFAGKKWGVHHTFFSRTIGQSGEFVYSFSVDENIRVYNPKEKNLHDFPAKSDKHQTVKPYETGDYLDYFAKNAHYDKIIFDKYRQVYYRFYFSPVSQENNFIKGNRIPKRGYVIILNDKFQKISETTLPISVKFPFTAFVAKNGLYVSFDEENKEDELRFLLYSPIK